ncbi:MAG TPA: 2-oxo-4-hydroxy-4-carboxy-5-ureidoimidazoline decarboxylase [Pyrinomonadaceae bacterium]|jgi:OHCU decarboxylase|nr:2-oxo-4-hydroxy-4-carboxy-5-ureidoimidazoline decarboxylase [Pyrinomonadaceae bacterium]
MIRLDWLNNLSEEQASTELLKCCGSLNWARQMVSSRPIGSFEELIQKANAVWWNLDRDDWLEAFRSHPKIGENKASAKISTQSEGWSGQEQAGINDAATQTLDELAKLNRVYEEKFGFIFIVCATGKSSKEMLAILKTRIGNDLETELPVAAGEQAKITEIRLGKLLT